MSFPIIFGTEYYFLTSNSLSNSESCLWKPIFGKTTGHLLLQYWNASSKLMSFSYIRYAITQVEDLDTPAKQWTRTPPPLAKASFMNAIAAGKCLRRLYVELSRTEIILYFKSYIKYIINVAKKLTT